MKIVEIIPSLSRGGAERFVVDLVNELSRYHEVHLILLFDIETNSFYSELSSRVYVHVMKKRKGVDLLLSIRLYRILKSLRPDIVHIHLRSVFYMIYACLRNRLLPVFLTTHTLAEKEAGQGLGYFLRWILFKSRRVIPIGISQTVGRSIEKLYDISDVPVIYNGRAISVEQPRNNVLREIESFRITEKTLIFVCIARVDPAKRLPLLAKVFSQLQDEGEDIVLLCIGGTSSIEEYQHLKKFERDRVVLLGEQENPLDFLRNADALVLTSSYEGLGLVVIESFALGIIPICSPAGGICDLVQDEFNGILADDLSESAFYRAMKRYLALPKEEKDLISYHARESYATYGIESCAKHYVDLFEKKERK